MRLRWMETLRDVAKRVQQRLCPGPLILIYHRVAEPESDPWSLCVRPAHFAEHLEVLRRRFRPWRLPEVRRRQQSGEWRRGVVVTFDDGYADNLHTAQGLLQAAGIPATVFITTGNLQRDREFWWDELDRVLLQPGTLPSALQLQVGGASYRWEMGTAAQYDLSEYGQHRAWSALQSEDPTPRHAAYREIWRLLGELSPRERARSLDQLVRQTGVELKARPTHRSMTPEEVAELAIDPLIEVGAHTVTHPHLARLPRIEQLQEIRSSRDTLAGIIGQPPVSFSYPHGSHTEETVPLVRGEGFQQACTSLCSTVRRRSDPYRLPRVEATDCDGDAFERMLSFWMPR